MEWREFSTKAALVGLSDPAARLLFDVFALKGHEHPADDIIADPGDGETQAEFNGRVSDAIADFLESPEEETEDSEDEAEEETIG